MASQVETSAAPPAYGVGLPPGSFWENLFLEQKTKASSLQLEAFDFLKNRGFPSKKVEDWRYSPLQALNDKKYEIVSDGSGMDVRIQQSLPAGVRVQKIFRKDDPEKFEKTLLQWRKLFESNQRNQRRVLASSKNLDLYRDATDALHEAFVDSFLLIEVSSTQSTQLQLDFVSTLADEAQENPSRLTVAFPRILVQINPQADFQFSTSMKMFSQLIDSKIQVHLHEGAKFSWIHTQENASFSTCVEQIEIIACERSQGHFFSFASGASLARQNFRLTFPQQLAEFKVHGTVVGKGAQKFDTSTVIEHLKGENQSEQIYKSILDEKSKSIFGGLVYIEKNAQLARSEQMNKSLLLSQEAEVVSKPQLEIYADDVKATHGSTVGQLSDEEIFYLKSRGISEPLALEMLSQGFAADLIYSVENLEQRNLLFALLKKKLKRDEHVS